ncbi:telomere-associated protein RIF1-like isoform X2 [Mya arenaria]|nr:telomere-associated protein RIF1-like isoform X2 [Mya arenaria]
MTSSYSRGHRLNPLKKHIGRRTGKNVLAGKKIRRNADGLDNFDDYMSESDADLTRDVDCMSEIHEESEGSQSSQGDGKENFSRGYMTSLSQGNYTASQLSQFSQGSKIENRSRFAWLRTKNTKVGRRTGKDYAHKDIRKDEHGLEVFDDYLSESDVSTYSRYSSGSSDLKASRLEMDKSSRQSLGRNDSDVSAHKVLRNDVSRQAGQSHSDMVDGQNTDSPSDADEETIEENVSHSKESVSKTLSQHERLDKDIRSESESVSLEESSKSNVRKSQLGTTSKSRSTDSVHVVENISNFVNNQSARTSLSKTPTPRKKARINNSDTGGKHEKQSSQNDVKTTRPLRKSPRKSISALKSTVEKSSESDNVDSETENEEETTEYENKHESRERKSQTFKQAVQTSVESTESDHVDNQGEYDNDSGEHIEDSGPIAGEESKDLGRRKSLSSVRANRQIKRSSRKSPSKNLSKGGISDNQTEDHEECIEGEENKNSGSRKSQSFLQTSRSSRTSLRKSSRKGKTIETETEDDTETIESQKDISKNAGGRRSQSHVQTNKSSKESLSKIGSSYEGNVDHSKKGDNIDKIKEDDKKAPQAKEDGRNSLGRNSQSFVQSRRSSRKSPRKSSAAQLNISEKSNNESDKFMESGPVESESDGYQETSEGKTDVTNRSGIRKKHVFVKTNTSLRKSPRRSSLGADIIGEMSERRVKTVESNNNDHDLEEDESDGNQIDTTENETKQASKCQDSRRQSKNLSETVNKTDGNIHEKQSKSEIRIVSSESYQDDEVELEKHDTVETEDSEVQTEEHDTEETEDSRLQTEEHDTEETEKHDTRETEEHDTEETEDSQLQTEEHDTEETEEHDTVETEEHDTEETEGHDTEETEEHDTLDTEEHDTEETEEHDTEEAEEHDTEGHEDSELQTEDGQPQSGDEPANDSNNDNDNDLSLAPSQALSHIDHAGNRSGSISKVDIPSSVVSFNRTKKRLSYSAMEASDDSIKSRRDRINQANAELKQDAKSTRSSYSTESEFLSIAERTKHHNNQTAAADELDDDTDSIIIVEEVKHKLTARESPNNQTQNKSKRKSSVNHVKLKTKLKKPRATKGRKTANVVQSEAVDAVSKKDVYRKKSAKVSVSVNDVYNINVSDDLEGEDTSRLGENKHEKSVKEKQNTKTTAKPNEVIAEVVLKKRKLSFSACETAGLSDNIDSNVHVPQYSNIDQGSPLGVTAGKRKSSSEEDNDSYSYKTSPKKQKTKSNRKLKHTSDESISRKKSVKKVLKTKNKKDLKTDSLQESEDAEISPSESQNMGKKSSKKNKNNIESEAKKSKQKKKSAILPKGQKKGKSSLPEDDDDDGLLVDATGGSQQFSPVALSTPATGHKKKVSTKFGSGVSFRHRSMLPEDNGSCYLSGMNVEVEVEPLSDLTPCISRPGAARKSRGRRVTICPEKPQENVIQGDGPEESEDWQEQDMRTFVAKKFRHSMGLSVTGLPDTDSTPQHICETTRRESVKGSAECTENGIIISGLIHPEESVDGLRRSKRTRLRPIAWYKNERVVVELSDESGPRIVGVKPASIDHHMKIMEEKRKKRKLMFQIRKQSTRSKDLKQRKLSIHGSLPDDAVEDPDVYVSCVNQATGAEDDIECIAKVDRFKPTGPNQRSPTSRDPYLLTHQLNHHCMSLGKLELRPHATKPDHLNVHDFVCFSIEYGKVLVKIHQTATVLETGDSFLVPVGNTYSIKNLRDDDARLGFVVGKSSSIAETASLQDDTS